MEKLSEFLLKAFGGGTAPTEAPPALTEAEAKDVMETLGVEATTDSPTPALDLILSKMKNVHEFSVATGEAAKEAENDEEFTDYGTVVIKTKSGKSTEGTLRLKKGDNRFGSIIFRGGDVDTNDLPSDAFSTLRVIETTDHDDTPPPWATKSPSKSPDGKPTDGALLWRAPEDWEVNIIALERGEWSDAMPEEAFRKYKKERPKLGGLFRGESKFYGSSPLGSTSSNSLPNPSVLSTMSSPSLSTPHAASSTSDDLRDLSHAVSSLSSSMSEIPSSASSPTKNRSPSHSPPSSSPLSNSATPTKSASGSNLAIPSSGDKSKHRKSPKKSKHASDEKISSSSSSSKDQSPDGKENASSRPAKKEERKWSVFKRVKANKQEAADS